MLKEICHNQLFVASSESSIDMVILYKSDVHHAWLASFQVLLMLSSDLEDNDRDRAALSKVLSTCLEELKLDQMVTLLNILDGKIIPSL